MKNKQILYEFYKNTLKDPYFMMKGNLILEFGF